MSYTTGPKVEEATPSTSEPVQSVFTSIMETVPDQLDASLSTRMEFKEEEATESALLTYSEPLRVSPPVAAQMDPSGSNMGIEAKVTTIHMNAGAAMLERRRIAISQKPLKQWSSVPDAMVRDICEFIEGRAGTKPDLLLDLYDTFCEPYWLSKTAVKDFLDKSGTQDPRSKVWRVKDNYSYFLTGNTDGSRKRGRSMSFDGGLVEAECDEPSEVPTKSVEAPHQGPHISP